MIKHLSRILGFVAVLENGNAGGDEFYGGANEGGPVGKIGCIKNSIEPRKAR
jgi:hypothetical protein